MEIPKYFNNSSTSESRNFTDNSGDKNSEKGVRILSVDRVTVEKIVLETCKSRKILLTKSESSRIVSEQNNNLSQEPKVIDTKNFFKLKANTQSNSRINEKKVRAFKNTSKVPILSLRNNSIPSSNKIRIRPLRLIKTSINDSYLNTERLNFQTNKTPSKLPFQEEEENFISNVGNETVLKSSVEEKTSKVLSDQNNVKVDSNHNKDIKSPEGIEDKDKNITAHNHLEKCQYQIEQLQKVLGTKINVDTAQIYKEKLPTFDVNSVKILPITDGDNSSQKEIEQLFDKSFLNKLKICTKLRIEENRLRGNNVDRAQEPEVNQVLDTSVKETLSKQVSELAEELRQDLIKNNSSESLKSYIEQLDSISSCDYDNQDSGKSKSHPGKQNENNSTLSDNSIEKTFIEEEKEERAEKKETVKVANLKHDKYEFSPALELNINSSNDLNLIERDGYANLIRLITMEPCSSKSVKEEKKKKGIRRLLPGIFSPKESRKTPRKDTRERKRRDDKHLAQYQQNGNYSKSLDSMKLNEDIRRNVTSDPNMLDDRIHEMKQNIFPLQGIITSTPDHFLQSESNYSPARHVQRHYDANPTYNFTSPETEWIEQNIISGSPDMRKLKNSRQIESERHSNLERKHSFQEPVQSCFIRNHGPSGRISAPPSERYMIRSRAVHPIDRPLPAIPQRIQFLGENQQEIRNCPRVIQDHALQEVNYRESRSEYYDSDSIKRLEAHRNQFIDSDVNQSTVQVHQSRQIYSEDKGSISGRAQKYSPSFSQKSGDYADSSYTPNSSQKSGFSPTSSKSGEYYLHSPHASPSNSSGDKCEQIETSDSYSKSNIENQEVFYETRISEKESNVGSSGNHEISFVSKGSPNIPVYGSFIKTHIESKMSKDESFSDVRESEDRGRVNNSESLENEGNFEVLPADGVKRLASLDRVKRVASPVGVKGGTSPEIMQGPTSPNRVQRVSSPQTIVSVDREQKTISPGEVQRTMSPVEIIPSPNRLLNSLDRVQKITSPDRIINISPDRVQKLTSPDRMQRVSPVTKQKIPSPNRIQKIPSPNRIQKIPSPNRIQRIASPDGTQRISSPNRIQGTTSTDRIKVITPPDRVKRVTSPLMIIPPISPLLSLNNASPNSGNSQGILKETNQEKPMSPLTLKNSETRIPAPHPTTPRKAQPSDQILIVSPKRDIIYDSPKPHTIVKSELVCPDSPIPFVDSPSQALNTKQPLKHIVAERAVYLRSPDQQALDSLKSLDLNKETIDERREMNRQENFVPNRKENMLIIKQENFVPNSQEKFAPNNFVPNRQENFVPNRQENFVPIKQENFVPNKQSNFVPNKQENFSPNRQEHFPPNSQENFPPNKQDINIPLNDAPKHFQNQNSIYVQRSQRNVQSLNSAEASAKNSERVKSSNEPLYSDSRLAHNQPINLNSPKMQSEKQEGICEKLYKSVQQPEVIQKIASPSKKQTMHHLENYFWQQKALDAQKKNSPTIIKHQPQIHHDAPEMRDAVYWQKLKKLDEEQQRLFYEQNQRDERNDPTYWKKKLQSSPTRKVHGSAPSLFHQTCPVRIQDESLYWENKGQRLSDNVVGKPPIMGQKVQNQPVLVVRPQPVAQERAQKMTPNSTSIEEVNRCQSASPRFLVNDDYKTNKSFEIDDKGYSRTVKDKGNASLVRKPQTPPIYEEDIDLDKRPPPIFKRGSLISSSNSSIEYGTMGPKRVSFSNQANCPTIGYGKWPTKHGMAPEPPTRRNKEDEGRPPPPDHLNSQVKIYGNLGQSSDIYSSYPSNVPVNQKNAKVNNLRPEGEYDANKPLPPPPRDATWSLRRTASLRESSRSPKVEPVQLKNEVGRKWTGLSESESGSEAGEVQRIFHRPDKKWTRSNDELESRTYENLIHYRKIAYVRSRSEPRKKSDVIPIESLKSFRKMLTRWKSKDKASNKSSSGDGSGSKRKRKFGREDEEWNPDGKGRQGNDIGGTGRTEGEGANDLSNRCGTGGGGVFGGGTRASNIPGGGGGIRSRDEPRRHTLSGDHQPSLHHQQFNSAQQIHPLHPHHLPSAHSQYGTLTGRHTMDLEMGTKSRQRKVPLPRGYPPPSTAMLFDDDPGIMSEVETSSTGFRRGGKQRSSLPVVRTPSKTLERPLGLVFLQYRSETKRALLPNEITSIDTVKALFVRSFPKQLTMEYLDSPHVKVYIHDSSKDMFYELEDLRSHLRDIRDRSVLRLFESSDGMPGPLGGHAGGAGLPPHWEDQSYFSEPEFDSEFQHQHIHKSKNVKNSTSGSYYIGGSSTLPRGGSIVRAYSPAASSVGTNSTPTQSKTLTTPGGGVAPAKPLRSYQGGSSRFSRDSSVSLYSIPDRIHGEGGYMSSPERGSGVGTGSGRYPSVPYSGASSYEDPYYSQYSGTVTPVIDEEASDTELLEESYSLYGVKPSGRPPSGPLARSPFPPGAPTLPPVGPRDDVTRLRVENMERQLANLTGIVQKALIHPQHTSPSPRDYLQIPAGREPYTRTQDKSVSFEKSVSFSDEPPDMNSPKQHSPQHAADTKPTKPAIKSSTLPRMSSQERERERHKPTPPPKPVALTTGQYMYGDLTLAPEMYNQLRVFQKKAKDLNQEKRNLRRMAQAQSHTVRESIRDAYITIRAMLMSLGENAWSAGDSEKLRLSREEDLYKQEMLWLEKDLTGLESTVEELRGNVINRKTRVNMSDVENMALILNKASKTVADLKVRFPSLQEGMKGLLSSEMEKVMREEKFLKEEPERLESVLKRCKKLTGTLVTLKRLASVQEQRLPNAGSVDVEETPPITPTSTQHSKTTAPVPAERTIVGSTVILGGGPHVADSSTPNQQRPENALDALLDELQTFSRPASQLSQVSNTSHPPTLADLGRSASHIIQTSRAPNMSDIGRKGSIDSTTSLVILTPGTNNTLRRLHSYPSSSDTDTSPPIARLQVSDNSVTPQKPPVPERNAELLQLATTTRRVPPPPPPRTSSRSPLASPTSPQLPPRNPTGGTLRRNRNNGKPPMALPANNQTTDEQPPANNIVSTSNSSSCESVNSQEGIQNKKGRHEQLEQRHQELLRRQKVLQEQYTRLQQFQNVPPAPSDLLKKTGSESNLLAKMGLGLSTTSSGSLTSLLATKSNQEQNANQHVPNQQQNSNLSQNSNQNLQNAIGNQTTTNKIYETDIL